MPGYDDKIFFLPGYDDNVFNDQILELHSVDLLLVQHLTIHILIVLEFSRRTNNILLFFKTY